jgi:hypothetical protein
MHTHDFILWFCLVAAGLLVAFGTVRLHHADRALRRAQACAAYRAVALVITERDKLRAGQHRAGSQQWGRAA